MEKSDLKYMSLNSFEEPQFVFAECLSFFKDVLIKSCDEINRIFESCYEINRIFESCNEINGTYDSNKYIIFGPIIKEINEYQIKKQDYETKDLYKFYHFFFVLLQVDKKVFESSFIDFLNNDKYFFCQIKSKHIYKFNNYIINMYHIGFETDEIEWGLYVFLIKKNNLDLIPILNCIVHEYGLAALSCFSGNQIIYYMNKFHNVFIRKMNLNKIIFPLEFFDVDVYVSSTIDITIFRNKFFIFFENIHKKFIQENRKSNNEKLYECNICLEDDINFLTICTLHCCQQYICLSCISKLFLSNQVNLNDYLLFVPCPFCRSCISSDSYSLKYENEEYS